ncbi:MAG: hypothetical protein RBT69_12445 [Spirochaetia bacterium]|jgi:hypothetical protein|nr:hypothetical protein [Spirochaetia bacterium]
MKIKYILLIFAATLFFSCNQSDVGIFYGLEKEVKIKDNSLSNNLTIGSMAKNGSELYIAAGRVYTKTSGSSEDWRKVSSPSGYDLSTSLAANATDSNVYAVFFDTDTAEKALFKMPDGGSWTKVTDPIFDGSIEFVKSAGSFILVSTRINSNDGKLYYSNGGAFTEVSNITMIGSEFNVIEFDTGTGDTYWISNHSILYNGVDFDNMANVLELDGDKIIKGLSEPSDPSDPYIYLSYWNRDRSRGYIKAVDGASINAEGDSEIYNLNGLTTFTTEGFEFLLCGTGGRGYRQISSPSDSRLDLATPKNDVLSENYTSAIELQNCVVLDFFVDGGDDGDLYALTATTGLWKNSLSGGTRVWSIE